jgi:hypothetical protein
VVDGFGLPDGLVAGVLGYDSFGSGGRRAGRALASVTENCTFEAPETAFSPSGAASARSRFEGEDQEQNVLVVPARETAQALPSELDRNRTPGI